MKRFLAISVFAILCLTVKVRASELNQSTQPGNNYPAGELRPDSIAVNNQHEPAKKSGDSSSPRSPAQHRDSAALENRSVKVLKNRPSTKRLAAFTPGDFNQKIYYANRLDVSLETGWLPINIPFVFDFLLGDGYNMPTGRKYTLAPNILSLHWQLDDPSGPSFLRGNWEAMFGGAYTDIPRGPETRYFAYIMGIRRNFVQRNWRVAPYVEGRIGAGDINAKEPYGVFAAQGQDFTFTLMLGSGLRYNINSRYAVGVGLSYMHISNLYLSEPKYPNYGINVYGPMIGFYMRLGKPRRSFVR
jgi:hypothetical protein